MVTSDLKVKIVTAEFTKRELFAAMAMQGMLNTTPYHPDIKWEILANNAVTLADTLIYELESCPTKYNPSEEPKFEEK